MAQNQQMDRLPAGKARSISILRVPQRPAYSPTWKPRASSREGTATATYPRGPDGVCNRRWTSHPGAADRGRPAQTGLNLQDGDYFTHRVEGDSMRDAGMRTGDILLVRRQANAREGDIVVAAVPDEVTGEPRATVKRLPRQRTYAPSTGEPCLRADRERRDHHHRQSDGALAHSHLTVLVVLSKQRGVSRNVQRSESA
jgi:hypothetical protein